METPGGVTTTRIPVALPVPLAEGTWVPLLGLLTFAPLTPEVGTALFLCHTFTSSCKLLTTQMEDGITELPCATFLALLGLLSHVSELVHDIKDLSRR